MAKKKLIDCTDDTCDDSKALYVVDKNGNPVKDEFGKPIRVCGDEDHSDGD